MPLKPPLFLLLVGTTATTFYHKLNDSFTSGPNLPSPIIGTTLVQISDSEHLIFGGSHNTYSVSSSKIYSSETGVWRPTAGSPPGNMNYGCTGTKVKDSIGEDIVIATRESQIIAWHKFFACSIDVDITKIIYPEIKSHTDSSK